MIRDELQALVDKQAEDEVLWSVPFERLQPIAEAYLQKELRKLHAAIESRAMATEQPVDSTELDNVGMVTVLNRYAEFKGGQKAAADMLGITPQYLCDILYGRRDVSETVAGKLGYDRQVVYRLHGTTRERV